MFKVINNENGIALMMVLVLLVLVGGLTAALMSAGVFNIRFGGSEVERTQAFYAADAGIEYLKAAGKKNIEIIRENDNQETIDDKTYSIETDNKVLNYQFREVEDDLKNDDTTVIKSTGEYEGNISSIEIDVISKKDSYEFDTPFTIKDGELTGSPDPYSKQGLDWVNKWFTFTDQDFDIDDPVTTRDHIDSVGPTISNEIIISDIDDSYTFNQNSISDSILIFRHPDGEEINVDVAGFSALELTNTLIIVENGNLDLNGAPNGEINNAAFLVEGDVNLSGNRKWENTMNLNPIIEFDAKSEFKNWRQSR